MGVAISKMHTMERRGTNLIAIYGDDFTSRAIKNKGLTLISYERIVVANLQSKKHFSPYR